MTGQVKPIPAHVILVQYPMLSPYSEIFDFMKENNCKVEQESFAATNL